MVLSARRRIELASLYGGVLSLGTGDSESPVIRLEAVIILEAGPYITSALSAPSVGAYTDPVLLLTTPSFRVVSPPGARETD